ncbi:hypothetical protein TNIN_482841 [Trichonephila inaurata madagascariensis]|uniref:Uncharacterized protein n=1 Tax=Trichonephila inaurata madagascariensis TaxID=2747483 RepID=A0A8X6XMC6_9ARAC|nr:hypothetical protein TNIN_482841 [Trichonephila inaurata madagascariensis]
MARMVFLFWISLLQRKSKRNEFQMKYGMHAVRKQKKHRSWMDKTEEKKGLRVQWKETSNQHLPPSLVEDDAWEETLFFLRLGLDFKTVMNRDSAIGKRFAMHGSIVQSV